MTDTMTIQIGIAEGDGERMQKPVVHASLCQGASAAGRCSARGNGLCAAVNRCSSEPEQQRSMCMFSCNA